nr:hypothetical protein [Aspergillus sp.]
MWGKAPFKARKPSGGDHRPTTTRTFQPSPPAGHSRDVSTKALSTIPAGHASGTRSVEISPPDSPISRPLSQNSGRVSPIEEDSQPTPKFGGVTSHAPSQIPLYQKRVEPQPIPSSRPPPQPNATRWDAYSGEPTTSNRGRTGQVNPSKVSFETHVSGPRQRSNSSKILDWGKGQLHSRKKASESRSQYYVDEITPFAPREPWRGQNGRSAMVHPIEEKPRKRSNSRLQLSRSSDRLRGMNTPSHVVGQSAMFTTTITAGVQNHPPLPRQQPKLNLYDHDAPKAEAGSYAATASRNASVVSTSDTAPPRVDLVSSPDLSASLTDLTLTDDDVHARKAPTLEPEPEPISRFSVTTYNTTIPESPNHSPTPSITTSRPASIIETASQCSDSVGGRSIMSRSRPVPSTIGPEKRPVRKPTPSEAPSTKDLPPNPANMTAVERIELLEQKRSELVRRKVNINTIINELTQVIQPSSIAYDMAAREEVKKTVVSLNNELAEIGKEEHDLGLKLLRLWKKRENEDFYGQSGTLWVKRVTS